MKNKYVSPRMEMAQADVCDSFLLATSNVGHEGFTEDTFLWDAEYDEPTGGHEGFTETDWEL